MITFFKGQDDRIFAVQGQAIIQENIDKLCWVFGQASHSAESKIIGHFKGPRANMVTPWSTNAVEIAQNMGITGISRIEEFLPIEQDAQVDPMLYQTYHNLNQDIFKLDIQPESILHIDDIAAFNQSEGLALSTDEVDYLNSLALKLGRKLTDSEVFGFSQVNSEHCRHKIFNGTFVIDGEEKTTSLFKLIKKTAEKNPNDIVSAYKDNVAFIKGPSINHFAPAQPDVPSLYEEKNLDSIISLKAETHNFPTTVEPFNGAATGSGGEIRDRLAGGTGSIPLAGTAVYMTSYSRLRDDRSWENGMTARPWLYQTPMDILIKASNGASDFGNKFGQPLIAGSVFTFEHEENTQKMGFDKVIMLAGGIGIGRSEMATKKQAKTGDSIVVMGGDNYRIGMGGAAVSSADTGEFASGIELNAVQRSNPEMQKRVANAVIALVENGSNPIVSIHDHGAGGHLNCLSELVENTGGVINLDALPVGDPTLSAKEIIGNESQERMGIVIAKEDFPLLEKIAQRERAPIYEVGTITDDHNFIISSASKKEAPLSLSIADMFGSSPKMIMKDTTLSTQYKDAAYTVANIETYLDKVLKLEAVACKDWLTNKVDRCVSGRIAMQQCCGPLQLPLNNCGIVALDYYGTDGIATSIGHAPVSALIDSAAGSRIAITEALTNIIWAPLQDQIKSVSLSANWMWPCKNPGEDARLYAAVEAASDFAIALGINIPTGKDSLSMTQKYGKEVVLAPGTVIISATAHCSDFTKAISPVIKNIVDTKIYYIDISQDEFALGGSSFAQICNAIGSATPDVKNAAFLKQVFNTIQRIIASGDTIIAGHDISSGGMITTLLEMCFADNGMGMDIDLNSIIEKDLIKILFAENSGLILQATTAIEEVLIQQGISFKIIGKQNNTGIVSIKHLDTSLSFDVAQKRDIWYETSYLLDAKQTHNGLAKERYNNYKKHALAYNFSPTFDGKKINRHLVKNKPLAAIIREKGSNSEREMANALYQSGFDVRDVHMTDLISGRETLKDVRFIGAVGGFSNSDVLGSAKGWAGAFKYNEKASTAITTFFSREDTMSIGICNGCQLFMELDLIYPQHDVLPKMHHNDSHKYESIFTSVAIQENTKSIMLQSLKGSTLGIWVAHGEGKFYLPAEESKYDIAAKFTHSTFPANPNGSHYDAAMVCSEDGRHLATMPHIERSFFGWNWPYYMPGRKDEVSPWGETFVSARKWLVQ
jgi:phosphoribosylformylglycinamidine synthase